MGDPRRLGMAQRRRIGASSNVYDTTIQPPSFGAGDSVRAKGRYGMQAVVAVVPSVVRPSGDVDGHGYVVQGGKRGRTSMHLSNELRSMGDLT